MSGSAEMERKKFLMQRKGIIPRHLMAWPSGTKFISDRAWNWENSDQGLSLDPRSPGLVARES